MRKYLLLIILVSLASCWKKQDHTVTPPLHPVYTLSGIVSYEATGSPAAQAEVSVQMTELYQGDFVDSTGTTTDETGYYEIPNLYRGRYDILVKAGEDTLYLSEVGIIKYEDKVYNISIPPPDTTETL